MNFIDLEKLKIDRQYNFTTTELGLTLSEADTIFVIKEKIRAELDYKMDSMTNAVPTLFLIDIETDKSIDNIDDADAFFTTAVNVIASVVLDSLCVQPHKGRPRERRLDVPEKLKVAHVNMSLLKKCINMKTYCDRFNLIIKWKNNNDDYHYGLVPQKGDEQND